jgi:hypothetical protein
MLDFVTRRGERVVIPNTYFHIAKERREPVLALMKDAGCRSVNDAIDHSTLAGDSM